MSQKLVPHTASLKPDGSHDQSKVIHFTEEALAEMKAGKRVVDIKTSWPGDDGMYYLMHAKLI